MVTTCPQVEMHVGVYRAEKAVCSVVSLRDLLRQESKHTKVMQLKVMLEGFIHAAQEMAETGMKQGDPPWHRMPSAQQHVRRGGSWWLPIVCVPLSPSLASHPPSFYSLHHSFLIVVGTESIREAGLLSIMEQRFSSAN